MSAAARNSAWIEGLLGAGVAAAERVGAGDSSHLLPEERVGHERWAPKRISEFAAGRECARLAMATLGVVAQPVLAQADRKPRWPEGIVGSITHCAGFAAAAVARTGELRSLGIDAEIVGALEPNLWPRVLGDAELEWLSGKSPRERPKWATVFFSAKEAWYKCQNPVTGWWLEFHEARIRILEEDMEAGGDDSTFGLIVDSRDMQLTGRGGIRAGIACTAFAWRA
jgi:4'-phosphopantetheinyl transferase EntD